MIYSMTGYGKAAAIFEERQYEVNIRSLNGKQLEVAMRLPGRLRDLESELRSLISDIIKRGRVEYSLSITPLAEIFCPDENSYFDTKRLNGYLEAARQLAKKNNVKGAYDEQSFLRMLSFPGVLKPLQDQPEAGVSEKEQRYIVELTREALLGLNEFRLQEGEMLQRTLLANINQIDKLRTKVALMAPERIDTIRNRLHDELAKLASNVEVDKNRFEQELIYYIEKLDVNEELTRLENHLMYFRSTLATGTIETAPGKKLLFITQELGREINTLGSKSNHASMQHLVVEMKDALEQVKEQLANVL